MKSMLTTIAITAMCGMTACAPTHTQPSDLELIQNQLNASNEKLDQLSQQITLIQTMVDSHQRDLQSLKAFEEAGADIDPLSKPPGGEETASAAPTPAPPQQVIPTAAVEPQDSPEDVMASEEEAALATPASEQAREAAAAVEPPAMETHQTPSTAQVLPTQPPSVPLVEVSPRDTAEAISMAVAASNPHYQEAMEVFRSGDYESAAPLFENFVEEFPEDDLADNALYWAGECKYTKKKFTEAIRRFKRVVEEYPTGSKVPDALLKIGFAYISLGDTESAETYLKEVIAQYPFSSAGAKAEARLKTLRKN